MAGCADCRTGSFWHWSDQNLKLYTESTAAFCQYLTILTFEVQPGISSNEWKDFTLCMQNQTGW